MEKIIELLKTSNRKILENVVADRDEIEYLASEDKEQTIESYIETTVKLSQTVEQIKKD